MKTFRTLILTATLAGALAGHSRLLEIAGIERMDTPMPVDQAMISPDGEYLIASTFVDNALWQIPLSDTKPRKITDNGRLLSLSFSPDCSQIAYVSQTRNENNLVYRQVNTIDLKTLNKQQVKQPSRSAEEVKLKNDSRPTVYIHHGELMLEHEGRKIALNPQGKEGCSYLWPSVSPDGLKVLYYLCGEGAFVCDLDGANPLALGDFRAPCWYGDDMVVAMEDSDNGRYVTESRILVSDLKGERQYLTDSNVIAMYPTASGKAGKILFSTPTGELYQITLKKK